MKKILVLLTFVIIFCGGCKLLWCDEGAQFENEQQYLELGPLIEFIDIKIETLNNVMGKYYGKKEHDNLYWMWFGEREAFRFIRTSLKMYEHSGEVYQIKPKEKK